MIGVDGIGIHGAILHYSCTIAFVGSAFLIFMYLFKKGRLDFDEEASLEMMKSEEQDE